jgi:hypothetical protein
MNKKVLSMPKGYRVKVFPDGTSTLYAPRTHKVVEEDTYGFEQWVDGFDDVCISRWPTDLVSEATIRTIAAKDERVQNLKRALEKARTNPRGEGGVGFVKILEEHLEDAQRDLTRTLNLGNERVSLAQPASEEGAAA